MFLHLFKKWSWIILITAAMLQCLFHYSEENIFAVVCCLVSWKIADVFLLKKFILYRFTFSSVILLGFAVTQFLLPTIFTLVEAKPLIFNMNYPYEVFTHSALAMITLTIAHGVYRRMQTGRNPMRHNIQRFLKKAQFFRPPTSKQIWIIGAIGLAGMIGTYLTGTRYGLTDVERGFAPKVFQSLVAFTYAPFFLLLRQLFDAKPETRKTILIHVVLYSLLVLVIGIGGNSRGVFMRGLTAMGIAYFIGLLFGKFDYRVFTGKNMIIGALGFWLITGPISDIGTAMVIVRGQRTDISSQELISRTLQVNADKQQLRDYKRFSKIDNSDWDEYYFDNIFLSRFCNLKFNDEGITHYKLIGGVDPDMRKYSIDRFWATLPLPVLNALDLEVDKESVISASFGDYLFYRAGGENAIGGFRTGQFASTGMASFGWWYLLLLAVGVVPLFYIIDLLVLFRYNRETDRYTNYLSMAGLTQITAFFMYLSLAGSSESVVNIYTALLRDLPQLFFLYWLVFLIARRVSALF